MRDKEWEMEGDEGRKREKTAISEHIQMLNAVMCEVSD